tara:strand:- start:2665 stop:3777 length:1113 start_codon:yes stop_codon:yes gene_type:complete
MKFSTSKTELQHALQKLSKATPTRSTLPILGCVLIESKEEITTLRSTDLELTIQAELPVSLEKTGSSALPLKTLLDITNELPETRVTLSVDDKNRVKITTDTGEYDLMAKPADEFPAVPDTTKSQSVIVSGEMLKSIIGATSFAVSKDELKPALTGVLFRFGGIGITAVSTDGHRLVRYVRKDFNAGEFSGDIIVPKKFLSFMLNQISNDNVELLIGENHLTAKMKNDLVITRIIDERFPDYESVIPKENDKKMKVDKDVFLGAIRRVSIFSNKSTHQVALNMETTSCRITTEDPEKSSKAQEQIIAEFEGDSLTIGYNADYLKDIVTHVSGEKLLVEFSTAISAALFSSDAIDENIDSLMLLMPIRLND